MAKNTVTADKLAVGKTGKGKVNLSMSDDAPLVVTGKGKLKAAKEEPTEKEQEEEEEEEEELEMLETVMVSLDQLIENPDNPRELFAGIEELAASIEHNGLKTPLVIRETGKTKNGKPVYMIVSGHRRTRAMKHLGKAFADVPVKAEVQPADYDAKQAIYDDLAFNDGKELTLLEQGTVFARARELGDKNADIARQAGKTQTHVQDCLLLHDKASAKLKKDISSGKMAATMVLDMLKEEGAEKTEAVLEKAKAENPDKKKITQKHVDKAAGEAVGKSKAKAKTNAAKSSKVVDSTKPAPKAEPKAESSESASARFDKLISVLEAQEGIERNEASFDLLKDIKKWLDRKIEAQDLAHHFFVQEEEEDGAGSEE